MSWKSFQLMTFKGLRYVKSPALKPRLFVDGSHFCILFGDNLATGISAFGTSKTEVVTLWNRAWRLEQMKNERKLIITGPQFDRTDNITPSKEGLYSALQFEALKNKSSEDLLEMGCLIWEVKDGDTYWLYPAEWYDILPDGLEIVQISGKKERFKKGETDNDRRYGMLSFGFMQEN